MIRAPGVSSRFRDGAPPSIDLQVWGVFSLKMLQECLLNHVAQLSWGLGSAPFHQQDLMTGRTFARNQGTQTQYGNQFRHVRRR
jgi:hypothetical protein